MERTDAASLTDDSHTWSSARPGDAMDASVAEG